MKLKTRLIIAFLTVILIPVLLTFLMVCGLSRYQINSIEKTYEITGTTVKSFANSMQVLSRLTEKPYHELEEMVQEDPEQLEDATCLEKFNKKLEKKKVNKHFSINAIGDVQVGNSQVNHVIPQLPQYGESGNTSENGVYLGGEAQALVKQVDYLYEDGEQGSAFIITDVSNMIPEVQEFIVDLGMGILIVLVLTALLLIFWIYRAVMQPLGKMQNAAQNIKEGNLDFELRPESDDELGRLCRDLEEMRRRLKDNAEEKVEFDKESKELISNISHDLKTPITAVKGYVEGIMDGVADTPEKMDRYIRTIYNKANEMDRLINELTFYSKIDTNRIPYTFNKIHISDYFEDCVDELSVELESSGVSLTYFNYLEEDAVVIADAEQLKRVINNIVSNSLKYMDKPKGVINIRLRDVGDFIQIEIEDNGKGIAQKDLANIFERFYRTDASRNSSKGGSGIGLSIVKKIMEDHGGQVWATSKEGTGTTMYLALRKYQEVPVHE